MLKDFQDDSTSSSILQKKKKNLPSLPSSLFYAFLHIHQQCLYWEMACHFKTQSTRSLLVELHMNGSILTSNTFLFTSTKKQVNLMASDYLGAEQNILTGHFTIFNIPLDEP